MIEQRGQGAGCAAGKGNLLCYRQSIGPKHKAQKPADEKNHAKEAGSSGPGNGGKGGPAHIVDLGVWHKWAFRSAAPWAHELAVSQRPWGVKMLPMVDVQRPRMTRVDHLTQQDCTRIARQLNPRPRKRLGNRTPEACYGA